MTGRFQFGRPAPRDSEILRRATSLKVELYRDGDGDLHGEVKIGCGFGMFSEDDGESYGAQKQAAALAFLRDLLGQFTEKRDDSSAAG